MLNSGTLSVIRKDFKKRKLIYLMLLPVVAYYCIFHYWPMYGAVIAFERFNPAKTILTSEWVGLRNFKSFFNSYYVWRLIRNTLLLNIYDLILGFPAPIALALLLNEVRSRMYKSVVQTVTYLPHFISIMVACGILIDFLSLKGPINDFIELFGGHRAPFLLMSRWFRPVFISLGLWQHVGWNSIIYLAALTGIDPQLYEAATIDGCSRWKQVWHITIPGILPTIMILLILRMGQMMDIGFEKIILLYNPSTYETADVISSFVYRKGLLEMNFSYSAAVGLFNSVVNFCLLFLANQLSRMARQTSLW
jgi:putative aldouronate transport system permease protein